MFVDPEFQFPEGKIFSTPLNMTEACDRVLDVEG